MRTLCHRILGLALSLVFAHAATALEVLLTGAAGTAAPAVKTAGGYQISGESTLAAGGYANNNDLAVGIDATGVWVDTSAPAAGAAYLGQGPHRFTVAPTGGGGFVFTQVKLQFLAYNSTAYDWAYSVVRKPVGGSEATVASSTVSVGPTDPVTVTIDIADGGTVPVEYFRVTYAPDPLVAATNGSLYSFTAVSNTAPVLDDTKSPTLAGIAEDPGVPAGASAGTLVSALVDFASTDADGTVNNVSDSDSGAVTGIAVTAISNQGTLYYTTNGGTNWTAAGSVSDLSALLLAADANTRVAFVPVANVNGSITDAITFKAWDRTAGGNGTKVDTGSGTAFSAATDTASIAVSAVNDPPTIGGAVAGQAVNDTLPISPFSTLTIADPDSNVTATVALDTAAKGVFTAASLTASGFSTSDGGATYTHASATPAAIQAAIRQLVFDPTDNRVAVGSTETTMFTVTVSDDVAAPVTNNTTTVVSTSVNDAPTGGGGASASVFSEDFTSSPVTVSEFVGWRGFVDVDNGTVLGIAIVATVGRGTWQYSTDLVNWAAFGPVDFGAALLLSASTSFRYVPDGANGEEASLRCVAWDQTTPQTASTFDSRHTADASSRGGSTAFSAFSGWYEMYVNSVNDAPVLDASKSPSLATIAEDTLEPTNGSTANSTMVSSLVGISAGLRNVTDVDTGAVTGIAVIAVSNHGTLYYTTDGGATWTAAPGTLAAGAALLLAADDNTRVAFVPQANLVGTDTDAITFKAWDRTSGSNGDTGVNTGVGSAFSTATDLAAIVITGVNDAPTINAGPYTLTGTNEDAAASSATQIDTVMVALSYADVDTGGILSKGIAVTATSTSTNGKWQYSTDGSTGWTDFGTVANNAALLLTSDTYVRYVPDELNGETATFTFRGWDRTVTALASVNGTPRYADTSTNGGSSEFSSGTASASIMVSSVNDAPSFVGGVTTLTVNENTGGTSIKALLHASDPDNGQTLIWTESAAPAHGTLAFSSATASTPGTDITPGGTITYTPTANYVGSDSFTVQVSDGTASATRTINVTINVVATELRFTTQPSGSVSGVALTGQPVVKATDASGNVDTTFTGNVTLSLGSGAGTLSGTLVKAAVAGVATFTDVSYAATADQQTFTLSTSNTASLTDATSDSVTSDVVATKLRFSTQPAPLTMASTVTRTFTTVPVVQAVDAANVVDTGYATAIVLSLTKNDGTAVVGTVNSVACTGDTDGSATTVTLTPASGAATFTGLSVRYTHAASTDSLALHATSGALTAANSTAITCREDAAPVVNTLTAGGTFTEGGAAVVVSYAATVTDADAGDTTCAWGTVSITQNFTAGQDVLSFTNDGSTMGNITAVYDAGSGVLTLTSAGATATKAEWANAVMVVKYANTSDAPNTATRQMVFVVNDGFLSSDPGYTYCKTNVTVVGTNDAPTLSGGPFALNGTDEDTISTATAVSTILAGLTYADPDGSVPSGIAITQKSGSAGGSWGYSTDGLAWRAIPTVSNTSALLLTSTSQVRYMPNGVSGETATLTFRAWDRTAGTASTNDTPGLADPSTNGGTTAFSTGTAQATLAVTEINDPPTLTATAVNPSFTENGSPVDLFSTVSVGTVEAGQTITELQFTITNLWDSTTESLVADGTTIVLTDGASGTTATNALTYAVSLSGTTATATLSKAAGITSTAAQDLIDGLTYGNTSDNPGSSSRVVTITSLKDNGGTLNGGVDTTALSVASTVAVTPANDAPAIGGAVAAQAVNDTATISPFATLTISDPDSDVSATVALDSAVKGTFTLGSLASSGFATADGGATYTHAATTAAGMQIAIRRLVFAPKVNRVAAGLTETTTFTVTLNDGVAAPVTNNATSVVSTSVNNAPVVTSGGAVTVQENQTSACTVTGSDVDPGAVLSYAISGGADAALFAIDAATGVVTFNSAPNFESPSDAGGNNVYDIVVTASDGVLTSTPRAVAITVINANEQPTDLALAGATVAQAAGTNAPVGTLSTTDPDAGDTFTYTLVAGTGATDNASFNISGAALRATNPALLAAGNHSVRVRSTDTGGLWCEKAFVVTATDNLGPTVASVTGPPVGVYRCGENLEFTVRFDDTVLVTGTPKLNLTIGGVAHTASHVSGSGSTDLLFRYTVVQGDHAASGEVVVGTIDLSGATIRDSVANDATLAFTSPTLTGVLVDALTHSADTNADWRISLVELTRMIELYNTRSGTSRTGEYHCEPGTEDGFAPGAGTLTSWHSADCDHNGRISLVELTRLIELYNTRSGTSRTGDYHTASGTEDGFAPGTGN
jgi:hypothetical protein